MYAMLQRVKKSFVWAIASILGYPAPAHAYTPCYCSVSVAVDTVLRFAMIRNADQSFSIVDFIENQGNCPCVQPIKRPHLVAGSVIDHQPKSPRGPSGGFQCGGHAVAIQAECVTLCSTVGDTMGKLKA